MTFFKILFVLCITCTKNFAMFCIIDFKNEYNKEETQINTINYKMFLNTITICTQNINNFLIFQESALYRYLDICQATFYKYCKTILNKYYNNYHVQNTLQQLNIHKYNTLSDITTLLDKIKEENKKYIDNIINCNNYSMYKLPSIADKYFLKFFKSFMGEQKLKQYLQNKTRIRFKIAVAIRYSPKYIHNISKTDIMLLFSHPSLLKLINCKQVFADAEMLQMLICNTKLYTSINTQEVSTNGIKLLQDILTQLGVETKQSNIQQKKYIILQKCDSYANLRR